MRTYWEFLLKSFKKYLAYRSEVWLRIFGSLISIFIQVSIWRALLGHGSVQGVGVEDMITYAILNTSLAVLLMTQLYREADDRLRTGDIAVDLLKPLRYPLLLFADQLGRSAFQLVFTGIPTIVVAWLLFGLRAPASTAHAAAFIFALAIALVISYAIGYLIALLSFWFLTTMHFDWALTALITVFSGSFLPIWFFPSGWATVARALPFQYLGFVPAATYMGQMPLGEVLSTLGLGVVWVGVLIGLTSWLWSASIRRLVVQGG